MLFRLYQRWNETDQRIRLLRIRIGTVLSDTPLLRNSSVSLRLTAPFTQRSLWIAQTRHISKTFGLLLFRPLRGHLPLKGKALDARIPLARRGYGGLALTYSLFTLTYYLKKNLPMGGPFFCIQST